MSTKNEVIKLFGVMSLAFPGYKAQDGTLELYAKLLADIEYPALEAAAKKIMTERKFFPAISEWREAAFDIATNAPAIPSAFEAWEEVQRQIRNYGSYIHPSNIPWLHPLIYRAVQVMGWRELCLSEQPEYDRAHYFKIYDSLLKRAQEDVRMLPDVRQACLTAGDQTPAAAQKSMALLAAKLGGKP